MKEKISIYVKLALIVLVLFLISAAAFTEEEAARTGGFFVSPLAETLIYGEHGLAFGAGFAIGAGDDGAIGIRFLYAIDGEDFIFMELLFFLRMYLFGFSNSARNTGPFLQLNGGPVLFAAGNPELTGFGTISAGLTAGWRFPFGNNWFIEPAIRAGYPYIAGGGLSAGYRR